MDPWQPIRLLAVALLVGYYAVKILDSVTKLHQGEIGLSFGRIREELVEGSHDGYCCYVLNLKCSIHMRYYRGKSLDDSVYSLG